MKKQTTKRLAAKNVSMDLGPLYKLSSDDYQKERRMFGEDDDYDMDDNEDLSPNRGPENERLPALENCLENSRYRLAISEPLKPPKPIIPRLAQKSPEDLLPLGTQEYKTYLEYILQQKHSICMTCWRFIDSKQMLMHERLGHVCTDKGIQNEESYQVRARTYGKMTEDECFIQKFMEYDPTHYVPPQDPFVGNNITYSNTGDHNGDKGKPPIIGPMMLPVQLQPNPNTNSNSLLRTPKSGAKPLSLSDIGGGNSKGQPFLTSGQLGYMDPSEKEKLAQVLGRVQIRMDSVESEVQEMLHKVRLMMMKDQYLNEQHINIMGAQNQQESSSMQWLIPEEESIKFNNTVK